MSNWVERFIKVVKVANPTAGGALEFLFNLPTLFGKSPEQKRQEQEAIARQNADRREAQMLNLMQMLIEGPQQRPVPALPDIPAQRLPARIDPDDALTAIGLRNLIYRERDLRLRHAGKLQSAIASRLQGGRPNTSPTDLFLSLEALRKHV
ncbi:MAG: hypothetical protein ACRDHP_18260, partial [Ktedonobacterales bacterium]